MKHQATIQPRMETYRTLLKQNTFLSGAAEECLKQLCAPEDQIYVTLWAPALVQYVAWVLEEAQKNRQKRLYFLARDAYPMYLVAKKMVEYLHIPIEICYLRVSRFLERIIHIRLLPVRTTHRLSENNDKIRCCSHQRISVNNIFFSMIIIFPCTDMSRKNFSTNAFLIDLSVCSYGTYITSFSLYVPTTFHQSFSKC